MKQSVKAKCESCGGTGLYQGMCEGKGRAVVCVNCEGTGCVTITYEPFEGRKRKRGVQYIKFSRGTFLAVGVGGIGDAMSYVEFEKTIPAPSKS